MPSSYLQDLWSEDMKENLSDWQKNYEVQHTQNGYLTKSTTDIARSVMDQAIAMIERKHGAGAISALRKVALRSNPGRLYGGSQVWRGTRMIGPPGEGLGGVAPNDPNRADIADYIYGSAFGRGRPGAKRSEVQELFSKTPQEYEQAGWAGRAGPRVEGQSTRGEEVAKILGEFSADELGMLARSGEWGTSSLFERTRRRARDRQAGLLTAEDLEGGGRYAGQTEFDVIRRYFGLQPDETVEVATEDTLGQLGVVNPSTFLAKAPAFTGNLNAQFLSVLWGSNNAAHNALMNHPDYQGKTVKEVLSFVAGEGSGKANRESASKMLFKKTYGYWPSALEEKAGGVSIFDPKFNLGGANMTIDSPIIGGVSLPPPAVIPEEEAIVDETPTRSDREAAWGRYQRGVATLEDKILLGLRGA